jgi:hypothetical protein
MLMAPCTAFVVYKYADSVEEREPRMMSLFITFVTMKDLDTRLNYVN